MFDSSTRQSCDYQRLLNIELGRHRQIQLQDRKCKVCNSDEVEVEVHFYTHVGVVCMGIYAGIYIIKCKITFQNVTYYLKEKDL